jgi:hypothetical protein
VSREVSLLPRHWEWLSSQPGGASAALRKLVEAAQREGSGREEGRRREEGTYRFMHALAGNLPGFEEASRALFAHDQDAVAEVTAAWPADVREHLLRMLAADAR